MIRYEDGSAEVVELDELARLVAEKLELAGLPVTYGGDYFQGLNPNLSGALVYFDPSADGSGGVFVTWNLSRDLMGKIVPPSSANIQLLEFGGTALDVMLDAVSGILVAAGRAVEREQVGVHESSVKIS